MMAFNFITILSILGVCHGAHISTEMNRVPICEGAALVFQYEGPLPIEKLKDVDHVHIISSEIIMGRNDHMKFPQLLHLAIEKSSLKGQTENFFEAMPSVNRLVMDNTKVDNFRIEDLSVMRNLEILVIKDQFIGELKAETFEKFTNLKELQLMSGEIEHINKRAFDHMNDLQILDLSRNELKTINKETLRPLRNLKHLILNNNQLTELTAEQIPELPELEEIYVQGNKISKVDIDDLRSKCPKLRKVIV